MKNFLIFLVCLGLVFVVGWYVFAPKDETGTDLSQSSTAGTEPLNAEEFWSQFRGLVLSQDLAKVAQNSKFPLQVIESNDVGNSTAFNTDSVEFPEIFSRFLKKGTEAMGETELDLIRKTNSVNLSANSEEFKVGGMVFGNDGTNWLLTELHFD